MRLPVKVDVSGDRAGSRERLRQIIMEKSVFRSENHQIISPRGLPQNWLVDMRTLFLNSEGLELSAELFWDAYRDHDQLQVAGLELGSIPFIAGVVLKGRQMGKQVNGLIIRRSRKKYGLMRKIEGEITDAPIVAVDDLMNSGGSLDKVRMAVEDEGRKLYSAFVLLNFEPEQAPYFDKHLESPLKYLFEVDELGLTMEPSGAKKPVKRISTFQSEFCFRAEKQTVSANFHVFARSTPCLDDERLYFGTESKNFYAIDLATGKEVWKHKTSDPISDKGIFSSPAISGGKVFFGGYDGNFYCLDAKTGKPIWINEECEAIGSSPCVAEDLGLVFVGLEYSFPQQRGRLAAFKMETGEKVWDYPVREFLHGSPVYSPRKQIVGIGTNDSTFVMCDARDGRELWMHRCRGPVKHRGCFSADERVVAFGSHDGACYILDSDTGKVVHFVNTDGWIYLTPVIVGDHVVFGSADSHIYVSNFKTKELVKKIPTDGRIFGSSAHINGSVFVGNNSGGLFEIETDTWGVVGRHQLPDRILSGTVYSDKTKLYYVHTGDDRIFAFGKS